MKTLRQLLGVTAALVGNIFFAGAAYMIGNHLFQWNLDKIAVEWQTSLRFAGLYVFLGFFPAVAAALLLRGLGRKVTLALNATAVLLGWVFLCILIGRMNAGYLWLAVGIPVLLVYFLVRGGQHLGGSEAA